MTRRRPAIIWPALVAILAAIVPRLAHASTDRLVAVVNDEIITASEVTAAQSLSSLDLLAEILPGAKDRETGPSFRNALDAMIDQRLLLQEARSLGLTATDDETLAAVQALTEERRLEGLTGATTEEVRQRVRDQLTIVKLVNREVRSKLMINASDVDAYYRAHQDRFMSPARYRLRQILIKAPVNGDPAALASAQAEANRLRAEATDGSHFGDLARRRSQGTEAARGGDLGYVRPGELLPEIDAVLGGMRAGDVSPVIATPVGFHIINLVETAPGAVRPIEEVKAQAEDFVYQEQATSYYRRWLRQLRSRAHIDIKP
jgi:peptidyl-prolyl cis-trans isomerase SurA